MKKIIAVIIILLVVIWFITNSYIVDSKTYKEIYIDPGHGGIDSGATYKEIKEKNLNLLYAEEIKKQLEEEKVLVHLTREGDYDLSSKKKGRKKSDISNRVKLVNESNASTVVSIHMNSEKTGLWKGPQVFYSDKNKINKKIANDIQESLNVISKSKRKSVETNQIFLLNNVEKAGILIEIGFLSNDIERNKILDEEYRKKLCKALVKTLVRYL